MPGGFATSTTAGSTHVAAGFDGVNVTVRPVSGTPALSTSRTTIASRAPVFAVMQLDVANTALAGLTVRELQLHEPAPALLHVHDKQALPPVQSRGMPPTHAPEPLQV